MYDKHTNIYEIASWTALGFVPSLDALGILNMQLAKEEKQKRTIDAELI